VVHLYDIVLLVNRRTELYVHIVNKWHTRCKANSMKWTLYDILIDCLARLNQEELERLAKFMGDSKLGPCLALLERQQTSFAQCGQACRQRYWRQEAFWA
jgi:hypothetical protein